MSNPIDPRQVLHDYDPNRQLSINWLFCTQQELPDAIHRRIRETGIEFVLREIDECIKSMIEFYAAFIPGDEAYGFVIVDPFETYNFDTEELISTWKGFARILVAEGILPNEYSDGFFNMRAQIIRHLYEVIDRFKYQPFGTIEHPNGELEALLQEHAKPEYMRRQFTEQEWEILKVFYRNMPDIDYATWWSSFIQ